MNRLKVGFFGYGGHAWQADQIRDALASHGHRLYTCHEYPNADVKYTVEGIRDFIDSMDVLIFPTRAVQPAKSSNKLVMAWSRRKAAIVSPLDAYLRIVEDGKNALIATSPEEFVSKVNVLAADPQLMRNIADAGYYRALLDPRSFNPVNYALKYNSAVISTKKVHVVIPHYSPRLDYIDLAVKSAVESTGVRTSIIVVSSSKNRPDYPQYEGKVKVIWSDKHLTFSQANNIGLRECPSDATHIFMLNDDAILSKNALKVMVDVIGDKEMVLNPYSNCDKGWLHNDSMVVNGKDLHPGMNIESFTQDDLTKLQEYDTNHARTDFVESPFAAFYGTMMSVATFNKVGILSEEYRNGGEDADYCFRAKGMGIKVGWTPKAFIFHFGGKSRKVSHETRGMEHILEDKYNNEHLSRKWPRNGKRIAIWTGPAWESWNQDTPYTTGIGGSETCAIRLAEQAAAAGHCVTMYGEHEETYKDGIFWKNWRNLDLNQEYFDLFISSRRLDPIRKELRAKKVVVWVHDIFLLGGVREIPKEVDSLVDAYAILSPWHDEFFRNYHAGYDPEKVVIIPNGLDSQLFA